MSHPQYVTFLWHMHQPYYKDPVRNEYVMPWTYLHAVKDYYDMAAIVRDTPGAKVVFNLVPSLLEQIVEYAEGQALDPFLLKGAMAPADMVEADRAFILDNFFSANRQRMIEPYPRYLELLYLAGEGNSSKKAERLRLFSNQDILDLQVWFFLAWTGEAVRRECPEVRELLRKGRNFTREDKETLFAIHRNILKAIIPLYRSLKLEGKAELSVTPYYHPILPLLCDMRAAQVAMPKVPLPTIGFVHPEDARAQVRMAVDYFTELFGFPPTGMWPSEGSVSDETLAVIGGCGIPWAATDEGVLVHSIHGGLGAGRDALYQPYVHNSRNGELGLFFRDHALSDLIGFTYSQWDGQKAVADFLERLRGIRHGAPGARVVSVILDGENAWEYYPENGYTFLGSLYGAIRDADGFELATFSEVSAKVEGKRTLGHIHPGSWINSNYGVWVGHPEENQAWDHIARARAVMVERNPDCAAVLSGTMPLADAPEHAQIACRSLYAAEGSDWFWWYGDDHFSPHADRFDLLFRRHLMSVYSHLHLEPPGELYEPIKVKSPAGFIREPSALISPTINGIVTDYFEWLGAGLFDLSRQASAMHASESFLHSFFYGFDRKAFYIRIDGEKSFDRALHPEDMLDIYLVHDGERRLTITLDGSEGPLLKREEGSWLPTAMICTWKVAKVCEVMIPLVALNLKSKDKMFASVTLSRDGQEVGRWPMDAPMVLAYAGPELELENWLI